MIELLNARGKVISRVDLPISQLERANLKIDMPDGEEDGLPHALHTATHLRLDGTTVPLDEPVTFHRDEYSFIKIKRIGTSRIPQCIKTLCAAMLLLVAAACTTMPDGSTALAWKHPKYAYRYTEAVDVIGPRGELYTVIVPKARVSQYRHAPAPRRANPMLGWGESVKVIDGDTIEVGGVRHRLWGVDSPEAGTASGDAATKRMRMLASQGSVRCEPIGRRSHGREVSRCSAGGRDLAAEMVRGGHAADAPRYSGGYYAR